MQIIVKVRMSDKVNRRSCQLGHGKEYDDNVITTPEISFELLTEKIKILEFLS